MTFCSGIRDANTTNAEEIMEAAFFTDEAWFHVSGYVNSQKSRVGSATNPREVKGTPSRDQKVCV
jgi:hypothetical protein